MTSVPAESFSHDESEIRAKDRVIRVDAGPLIVGVLNVTPDSFFDGGKYVDRQAAVAHAVAMAKNGADLLDIGAESSRPGSLPIDEAEEMRRLIPIVKAVCEAVSIPISVDTTKASVARQALEAGAAIVNDISGLRFDRDMAAVVAETGAGLVLMHMQGTPRTMQQNPVYGDVVQDVKEFFAERIEIAVKAGISTKQIILDPGIGFGKLLGHNLTLLARLRELATFRRPLMVGVSRKSFIGQVLGRSVNDRLFGTAAAVAVAVAQGAALVRVHDVAEMKDVVRMVWAIVSCQPSVIGTPTFPPHQ
jgi:dihydropteroate synthase